MKPIKIALTGLDHLEFNDKAEILAVFNNRVASMNIAVVVLDNDMFQVKDKEALEYVNEIVSRMDVAYKTYPNIVYRIYGKEKSDSKYKPYDYSEGAFVGNLIRATNFEPNTLEVLEEEVQWLKENNTSYLFEIREVKL